MFAVFGGGSDGDAVDSGGFTGAGVAREAFAFFALVGFAAGFTERFATDLIERAAAVVKQ